MAKSSHSLLFVCRSCRQHLQKASPVLRPFTTTPQRSKTIVHFQKTTLPQFDEFFQRFRDEIFAPSAFSKTHRALIYKPSRSIALTKEPGVTVTLSDGEDYKLQPLNRFKRPDKRSSLYHLTNWLGTTNNTAAWENVVPFLEGMFQAAEKLPDGTVEKLTRRANEQNKTGIIVKCAEMAKKTNVRLCDAFVTRELFLGCHRKAVQLKFQGDEFLEVIRRADTVALLLEREEHCGGQLNSEQTDMRRSVTVMGVLLELAAGKALNMDDGEDVDGRVASLVPKVLALTKDSFVDPLLEKKEKSSQKEKVAKTMARVRQEKHLENLVPLWHGMKLATQVKYAARDDQAQTLVLRSQRLDTEVEFVRKQVALDSTQPDSRRGAQMYDNLKQ